MGMDFGDGPDFDAIKEEREQAKAGPKTKVVLEEDCWEHLYYIQMYKPKKNDDGMRAICKNSMTGKFRLRKRGRPWQNAPSRNTPINYDWEWDGEAYERI